jgi:hypothetical protein
MKSGPNLGKAIGTLANEREQLVQESIVRLGL